MKRLYMIVSALLVFSNAQAQDTLNVLFLGNSYTAVNNLPQLVHDVAKSAGDSVYFASNTPGGYTLDGHSTNTTSTGLIAAGGWDFVVLQEQSQLPSFTNAEVESMVFPFAKKLDSLILLSNTCAETVFYMTWGRKNGDASNCALWPPVCTYEGMDSLLYLRYMMMADSNDAIVSPVGAVWHYLRENNPGIELYSADESHPSVAGSYAAACSFYTVMFRNSPMNITFDNSLNATDAANIRAAVKLVVFDSLMKWHVGEYDPMADFTATPAPALQIDFTNTSTFSDSWFWDFGDGQSSTYQNPTHVYASAGSFQVTLIASRCGLSDTATYSASASTTGVRDDFGDSNITVFPNPAKDKIKIVSKDMNIRCATIFQLSGQKVISMIQNADFQIEMDVSELEKGLYFIEIVTDRGCYVQKLVVEQ